MQSYFLIYSQNTRKNYSEILKVQYNIYSSTWTHRQQRYLKSILQPESNPYPVTMKSSLIGMSRLTNVLLILLLMQFSIGIEGRNRRSAEVDDRMAEAMNLPEGLRIVPRGGPPKIVDRVPPKIVDRNAANVADYFGIDSRHIIRVPPRKCPEGEQRDYENKCRKEVEMSK